MEALGTNLEAERRPVGGSMASGRGEAQRRLKGGGRARPPAATWGLGLKSKCGSWQGSDAIRLLLYKDHSGICVENGLGTRGYAGRSVSGLNGSPRKRYGGSAVVMERRGGT